MIERIYEVVTSEESYKIEVHKVINISYLNDKYVVITYQDGNSEYQAVGLENGKIFINEFTQLYTNESRANIELKKYKNSQKWEDLIQANKIINNLKKEIYGFKEFDGSCGLL